MGLVSTAAKGGGGGGSGTVTQVSSADTSIAVATGTTTPVLTVAALNTIAANHATSGSVAMNSNKLTGLAAGSGAGDSLRYEQAIGSNVLAVSNLVAGTAGQVLGGTGPSYALPPGYEINYTQTTSTVSVSSNTEASGTSVLAPGSITFDGGAVLVHFFCPRAATGGTTGNSLTVCLFEGSTEIGRLGLLTELATASQLIPFACFYRFTPSAGAHTYTLTAFGANTPLLGCGAGGTATEVPMFVRFTKV